MRDPSVWEWLFLLSLLCLFTIRRYGARILTASVLLGVILIAYHGAREHTARETWCRANIHAGYASHIDAWRYALDACLYGTECQSIGPEHPATLLGGRGPLLPWNASTFYAPSDRVLRHGVKYVCAHWHTPCDPVAEEGMGIWLEK